MWKQVGWHSGVVWFCMVAEWDTIWSTTWVQYDCFVVRTIWSQHPASWQRFGFHSCTSEKQFSCLQSRFRHPSGLCDSNTGNVLAWLGMFWNCVCQPNVVVLELLPKLLLLSGFLQVTSTFRATIWAFLTVCATLRQFEEQYAEPYGDLRNSTSNRTDSSRCDGNRKQTCTSEVDILPKVFRSHTLANHPASQRITKKQTNASS